MSTIDHFFLYLLLFIILSGVVNFFGVFWNVFNETMDKGETGACGLCVLATVFAAIAFWIYFCLGDYVSPEHLQKLRLLGVITMGVNLPISFIMCVSGLMVGDDFVSRRRIIISWLWQAVYIGCFAWVIASWLSN